MRRLLYEVRCIMLVDALFDVDETLPGDFGLIRTLGFTLNMGLNLVVDHLSR
jgi:hypothetical protein